MIVNFPPGSGLEEEEEEGTVYTSTSSSTAYENGGKKNVSQARFSIQSSPANRSHRLNEVPGSALGRVK